MTPRVAILDYGCGNLGSVANAVRKVGGEPFVIGRWPVAPEPMPTHLVLPGQGHFGAAMEQLQTWACAWARGHNVPILGICLGMQLMCESSEEAPGVPGLGWLPYRVVKMPVSHLPHIGWNGVEALGDYYFCHSYAVPFNGNRWPAEPPNHFFTIRTTTYDTYQFVSLIRRDHLWAVQFHPEKSGGAGLNLLAEFLKL